MIFINFTGLDMFLIGELNGKCHSKVAKAFGVSEDDLLFTASDSFVFYKGHEQTSFNLVIKVDAPNRYLKCEKEVSDVLFEACKEYSIHVRLLFSYYNESSYYESIDKKYCEFLEEEQDVVMDESNYDQDRDDYSDEDIYLGNVFEDNGFKEDDEAKPLSIDDLFKRN